MIRRLFLTALALACLGSTDPRMTPSYNLSGAGGYFSSGGTASGPVYMLGNDIYTDINSDSRWENGTDNQVHLYLNSSLSTSFYETRLASPTEICLGGATSSFPALERTATTVLVQTCGTSTYTPIAASTFISAGESFKWSGSSIMTAPVDGDWKLTASDGTTLGDIWAGTADFGGGALANPTVTINGTTSSNLVFGNNGVAAPSFTTRSAGTKIVIYDKVDSDDVDYAIGLETGTIWSSVPKANSSFQFKWYGGETEVMNLDGAGQLTLTGPMQLDTSGGTPTHSEGLIFYDTTQKTLAVYNDESDLALHVGSEDWVRVYNNTGSTIDNGKVVALSGNFSGTPQVVLADATDSTLPDKTIGLAAHSIENGTYGYVTHTGLVQGLNTSAFSVNDLLYLDASTPGALTATRPLVADAAVVQVGVVTNSDASTGKIQVHLTVQRPNTIFKSYSLSVGNSSGDNYLAGFYVAPAADANLDEGSTSVNYGTATYSYAAHAFIVAGGAGTADAGTVLLRVSGTSIDDASGTRTTSDTEDIVADITALSTNEYAESTKKWLGQVTFTLIPSGATTYSLDFNYGFAKYEDYGNRDFIVTDFEFVGRGGAVDTIDATLYLHDGTGWTYSAAAFSPGGTVICDMSTDHSTDVGVAAGSYFAYKRADLSTVVDGSGAEGVVVEITNSANNSIRYSDIHIGVQHYD